MKPQILAYICSNRQFDCMFLKSKTNFKTMGQYMSKFRFPKTRDKYLSINHRALCKICNKQPLLEQWLIQFPQKYLFYEECNNKFC